MVNPLILLVATVALGGWLAPKVGLDAPFVRAILEGRPAGAVLRRQLEPALLVWVGWKLGGSRRPVPPLWFVVGAVLGAVLFAAGHLPLLYMLMPSPRLELVAAVLVGNALPGFAFGMLFWRRGLEAAMLAHATAHFVAVMAVLAVTRV